MGFDPVTLSAVVAVGTLVTSAIGAGLSATSRREDVKASNRAGEYNAQLAERNAEIVEIQAIDAEKAVTLATLNLRSFTSVIPSTPSISTKSPLLNPCAGPVPTTAGLAWVILVMAIGTSRDKPESTKKESCKSSLGNLSSSLSTNFLTFPFIILRTIKYTSSMPAAVDIFVVASKVP